MSDLRIDFRVVKCSEGAAITTSEFELRGPALFNISAIALMLDVVPLHFQFPPIRAFAIFPDIFFLLYKSDRNEMLL